jgi:hypothetical protein
VPAAGCSPAPAAAPPGSARPAATAAAAAAAGTGDMAATLSRSVQRWQGIHWGGDGGVATSRAAASCTCSSSVQCAKAAIHIRGRHSF